MDDIIKKEPGKKGRDSFCLDEFKEKYNLLRAKYNFPSFDEMNKAFDIEELDFESDMLIRKMRRFVSEKIAGYMRFIEALLNPSNAPIFFFKLIKKLDNNDKENLTKIYEELGNVELETLKMDLEYNEELEAKFINNIYKLFNENVKVGLLDILKKLGNGENNKSKENGNSYFG